MDGFFLLFDFIWCDKKETEHDEGDNLHSEVSAEQQQQNISMMKHHTCWKLDPECDSQLFRRFPNIFITTYFFLNLKKEIPELHRCSTKFSKISFFEIKAKTLYTQYFWSGNYPLVISPFVIFTGNFALVILYWWCFTVDFSLVIFC